MNGTQERNTRATKGTRTRTRRADKFDDGRVQIIRRTMDTFTCTDGTQVVRVTTHIRMVIKNIMIMKFVTLHQSHDVSWETVAGNRGWNDTMQQACRVAREGR